MSASSLYLRAMARLDKHVPTKWLPLWNHPAGPKTVFFWAPLMKWCLVAAGLKDISRPADKLSVSQNVGT